MWFSLFQFAAVAVGVVAAPASDNAPALAPVSVSSYVPSNAGAPILDSFVSFSIEFAFFPDFAGNLSQPNLFSNQLLENLAAIQGSKPLIRVGGNTQDYALYDPTLTTATNGTVIPSRSPDYPYILFIGKSYFESYATWPNTRFIHGFNLGKNGSAGLDSLLATVPLVCSALEHGRLAYWELGNEPDLFKTSAQGVVRPANWTERDYVGEWLSKTRLIRKSVAKTCPNLASDALYKYYAPSFAGVTNSLNPVTTWRDGLDADNNVALNSEHNYIGGATQPGVTLQGTLMNHSSTVASVAKHLNVSHILQSEGFTQPYILGETNSLYNEGAPGLSNAFGAALWGCDFNLWCASQSIRRVHMHQGTDYRYGAWQPIETAKTTVGTKAPYYGSVFVAEMLRNPGGKDIRVVNLPLPEVTEAAYAAYVGGKLERIAVINMIEFNYTAGDPTAPRPSATYSFHLGSATVQKIAVQRLISNGSNAISGITWDGYSYNHELEEGKPVRLSNVTVGETVAVTRQGVVEIEVPYSSALILNIGS